MCFSASASITAGVLLTVIGIETLRKVHKPAQIVFASIPLVFAFQQFSEAVLWLTIPQAEYSGWRSFATYVYLLMAQIIWPAMVPLSILLMEENKVRRKMLSPLLASGVIVAAYYAYGLLFFDPIATISRLHIDYQSTLNNPFIKTTLFLYLSATIAPLFVSSIKRTHLLGIIVGLSFIVSLIFYSNFLISVWCFFSAIMSFVIFYIIRDSHKKRCTAK